jgi:hypothetical protein
MVRKAVQQTTRRTRLIEAEPMCEGGLEHRAEAVLRAACKQMQMTPQEPQKAVRFDQWLVRKRGGSA